MKKKLSSIINHGLIVFFDRSAALLMLVCLSPVMLFTAIVIALFISHKVIFRQTRPGLHGKPFTLYKFRTMIDQYDQNGHIAEDKLRLNSMGMFIRKWSLDELPQLINVIKGDLALVGPRPLLMEYLPLYEPWQMKRHHVRPGMTGWAQINGRNTLSWDKRFELDCWYVEHQSFWLNIYIIAITCMRLIKPTVIHQEGHVTMSTFDGKPSRLIIVGAGGHGRVVADSARAMNKWRNIVFVDDRYPDITQMLGIPVVGTTKMLDRLKGDVVVAIGDNALRLDWQQALEQTFDFATIIHPSAVVSSSAIIGEGSVIFAQAVVQAQSVIVNAGAKIDHDTYLGDGAHVSSGATVAGLAHVGQAARVGMHAAILPGVEVGERSVIGAGVIVNKDVENGHIVKCIPAKPMEVLV